MGLGGRIKFKEGTMENKYMPVVECPKCGCLYRSDGSELCPQRGLKQHKE